MDDSAISVQNDAACWETTEPLDYQLQSDVDHIAQDIKHQQELQQRRNAMHSEPSISCYCYNDIIQLDDKRLGKIKFIGTLGFDSDIWIGLILQSRSGSHNGTIKSRTYWRCPDEHGTFIRCAQIQRIKCQRIGARFSINTKVRTPRGKGIIRYIGSGPLLLHQMKEEVFHQDLDEDTSDHLMYGIELLDQIGENSGSINGQYYFTCAHCRGIFFSEEELVWIPPDAPSTPRRSRSHNRHRSKRPQKQHHHHYHQHQHLAESAEKDQLITPSLLNGNGNGNGDESESVKSSKTKKRSMEIIGLDEENQSIDIDSVVDKEELDQLHQEMEILTEDTESVSEFEMESENGSTASTMDSLSDSSSDEEYFSSAEVQRIQLMGGDELDDRMSFARILSDFKYVQKVNSVRTMAMKYETFTKKQRFSASKLRGKRQSKSEAEKAQEIIKKEKRRRGLSNGTVPPITSVYSPPRFADSVMEKTRFKRKRNSNQNIGKTVKSLPTSPEMQQYQPPRMKRGDSAPHHSNEDIKRTSVMLGSASEVERGGSFRKILPPNTRKKTKRRKVHFDEVSAAESLTSPSPDTSISTFCLSPKESLTTHNSIAEESDDIKQDLLNNDEYGNDDPLKLNKSRNSETFKSGASALQSSKSMSPPLSSSAQKSTSSSSSCSSPSSKRFKFKPPNHRGKSVPIQNIQSFQSPLSPSHSESTTSSTLPPSMYRITSNPSLESNLSVTSSYVAPQMITPGGGIPDLLNIRNSLSSDEKNEDCVAVVQEMEYHHDHHDEEQKGNSNINDHGRNSTADYIYDGNATSNSNTSNRINDANPNSINNSIPSPITTSPTSPIPMSHSVRDRSSSWMFQPAEDSEPKAKLKAIADSPFDIASTAKDFQKVSELLMLECNNPKNLFKVLKGISAKLKFNNATYRKIDTQDYEVRSKLLRFNGAEEFLNLLGFDHLSHNPQILECESNQPPLAVLDAAIGVCNDCLLKCNQKRAMIDMIKKFGRGDLKKRKRKKSGKITRKKRNSKSRNNNVETGHSNVVVITPSSQSTSMGTVNENQETPLSTSLHSAGGPSTISPSDDVNNPLISTGNLSRDHSFDLELNDDNCSNLSNLDSLHLPSLNPMSRSMILDDATATLTMDDLKFEEELEAEEDRFQLSDIIWSITHKNNHDKEARAIILLCFPTFSDSKKLIKCLIERFFEPDESKQKSETDVSSQTESSVSLSGGDESLHFSMSSRASTPVSSSGKYDYMHAVSRIESLWEVQAKVVSFLQQWMRTYWPEDWDEQDEMIEIVEQFAMKIEECYRSDPTMSEQDQQKGLIFVKMLHQTITSQEAKLKSKEKKRDLEESHGSVPSKFERLSEMSTAISQMRYNFIKLDNRRLAEQITKLDFKYFKAIQKRECLGQAWKKDNKYERAANICALIDQFNKMSKWVQCTILLAKNVKQRGRLIKKFIKVSNELLALRNFQSLCAFHGALSSVPVHKLKHAWSHVPAKHVARFQEMKVIFNTRNNMGNLRKLHREALVPLVPYTGIFLSDLVSIEEGNKKHKDDGTVNFAKLMRLSNAIDNILLYQSSQYNIADDQAVQSLLLEDFKINEKLDADYIYKFAADVARKDQPRKKKSVLKLFKTSSAK